MMVGEWNKRNHRINEEFLSLYEVALDYAQRKDMFLDVNISPRDTERSELELTLSKFEPRTEIESPGKYETYGADQVDKIFVPYTKPVAKFVLTFGPNIGFSLQVSSDDQRETAVEFFNELDFKLKYSEKVPEFRYLVHCVANPCSRKQENSAPILS